MSDKTRERLATALGIALAALLLWALCAYVFIWHDAPNLERIGSYQLSAISPTRQS